MGFPQRKITPHQLHPERLPVTLTHPLPVSICLPIGKPVRGCSRCIVIAHHTQGQQAITIVALLLRKIVEIQLAIIRLRIYFKNPDVFCGQSFPVVAHTFIP